MKVIIMLSLILILGCSVMINVFTVQSDNVAYNIFVNKEEINLNDKLNITITLENKNIDESIFIITDFVSGFNDSTIFIDFGGELFNSTGDTEIEMTEILKLEKYDLKYQINYHDLVQKIKLPKFNVIISIGITDLKTLEKYKHLSNLIDTKIHNGLVYTSTIVVDASLRRNTFEKFKLTLK